MSKKKPILVDFHNHSRFSDGKLSLSELCDLKSFLDVICNPLSNAIYVLRVPSDMTECEQARRWVMHDKNRNEAFLKPEEMWYSVKLPPINYSRVKLLSET